MTTASSVGTPADARPHPLTIPDFRYFLAARFCATVATIAMVVIIGWQVYDTARTDYAMSPREAAFQLGLLGLIQFVPLAIVTPFAGWAADRFERRLIARFANVVDASVATALAICTANDQLTLPLLFAFAAAHGFARAFVGPALSAIAPNIVPAASLPRAIALSSIAWQSGSVIGPAAGGMIYALEPQMSHWMSAALLLLSFTLLGFVRPVLPPPPDKAVRPIRQILDGLYFTMRERFLLGAITLDLFAVLLAGATALLPVFARDILMVGPEGLGQLRAAPAVGAATVALFLSFVPVHRNVGVKMLWAVVVFGLATILFGLSTSFILSLAALVLLGAADMFSVYVRGSLVQLNTPDHMRGRVSAVSGLAISASNELGEMQSGVAAALLGPVGAVVFGGAGAILVVGIWSVIFPELRNARTFAPQFRSASDAAREDSG